MLLLQCCTMISNKVLLCPCQKPAHQHHPLFSFMSVNIRGQELFRTTVTLQTSWALHQILGGVEKKRFQSCLTFNFRLAAWLTSHHFTWVTLKRKIDNDKLYLRKHWITWDRVVYNWLCSTALWMNRLKSGTYNKKEKWIVWVCYSFKRKRAKPFAGINCHSSIDFKQELICIGWTSKPYFITYPVLINCYYRPKQDFSLLNYFQHHTRKENKKSCLWIYHCLAIRQLIILFII